ncbi:MAG TPA: caspase family protein, partial [Spirochaetota bacterium]|nr:caspase family protein [Spirochaetota bacterium]
LSVAFSPDGKTFASTSEDNSLKIWDIASGKEIRSIQQKNPFSFVAFSPDGKTLLAPSYPVVKLWDMSGGKEIKTLSGKSGDFRCGGFSPDGKTVVLGSFDYYIKLCDVESGKEIRNFMRNSREVYSTAISLDGKTAVEVGSDTMLQLWDITRGREMKTFKGKTNDFFNVALSSDGKMAICGGRDATLQLWDITKGKQLRTFIGHSKDITSVKFFSDGKNFISASRDKTLKLWDINQEKSIRTFTGHTGDIYAVAISPDDKSVVSGSGDNTVRLWDVKSGKEVGNISVGSGDILDIVFSTDGKSLIGKGRRGVVTMWDIASGKEKGKIIQGSENISSGAEIAISPDGKISIGSRADNNVQIWDIEQGRIIKTISGYSTPFSYTTPNEKTAISISINKTFSVCSISKGEISQESVNFDIFSGQNFVTKCTATEIAQFVAFKDGEWVIITPDGYFNASPHGAKNINVIEGMNVYSIDNFFDKYYRPDIVEARLSGIDTSKITETDIRKGIKTPPEITLKVKLKNNTFQEISSGEMELLKESGKIKILISAKDTGGGIKGIRLFNNNKVVGENIRGLKIIQRENILEQEFEVALSDGENILKGIGFSDDMTESNPVNAVILHKAPVIKKPNMYIFAIGINEYKNSKYNLNYCEADAKGFVDIFQTKAKSLFENVEVTAIYNRNATRQNILTKLIEATSKINQEDVFIFYYAGHGITPQTSEKETSEFYYILSDVTQMTDPDKCKKDGISLTEMREILKNIKAAKQIVFVDACNSGAIVELYAKRGAAEEIALAKLSRATGSVIMVSTTKDQFAQEFAELKHGVFTFVLLEGLSGKGALANGQLTANSIKLYVDEQIPEITRKYKGEEQSPVTFMWGQDFPIGIK